MATASNKTKTKAQPQQNTPQQRQAEARAIGGYGQLHGPGKGVLWKTGGLVDFGNKK